MVEEAEYPQWTNINGKIACRCKIVGDDFFSDVAKVSLMGEPGIMVEVKLGNVFLTEKDARAAAVATVPQNKFDFGTKQAPAATVATTPLELSLAPTITLELPLRSHLSLAPIKLEEELQHLKGRLGLTITWIVPSVLEGSRIRI